MFELTVDVRTETCYLIFITFPDKITAYVYNNDS